VPNTLSLPVVAVDYNTTLVLALETSSKNWVLAAHVPGTGQVKAKQVIAPSADALEAAIEGYRRRAAAGGQTVERVILVYEAGHGGFWLARWLKAHGIEVHVIQPSSVPVERKKRRAKSDNIDADLLLRTLLAWLRGEPRVCSMVPIPDETAEDARRPSREREELVRERISLTNRIGAVLTTLGVDGFNPLRKDRRKQLEALRTPFDQPLPEHAKAKIVRSIDRLELVMAQITALEDQRDAVLEQDAPGMAQRMIQALVLLRAIGAQTATVLVYEAFVRHFSSGKALGSYAGLTGTPFNSGGAEREQGISKAGNQRLRATIDGRTGMAVGALSAGKRIVEMVPGAVGRREGPHEEDPDRCDGAQAAHRPVAICHSRRHPGRCGVEAGLIIGEAVPLPLLNQLEMQ
jgi:transposase